MPDTSFVGSIYSHAVVNSLLAERVGLSGTITGGQYITVGSSVDIFAELVFTCTLSKSAKRHSDGGSTD